MSSSAVQPFSLTIYTSTAIDIQRNPMNPTEPASSTTRRTSKMMPGSGERSEKKKERERYSACVKDSDNGLKSLGTETFFF